MDELLLWGVSKVDKLIRKTQTPVLNGIMSFYRFDRPEGTKGGPDRVYILGEFHGRQTSGTHSYVEEYKKYFTKYRETDIDMLFENELDDTAWTYNWLLGDDSRAPHSFIFEFRVAFAKCMYDTLGPCEYAVKIHDADPKYTMEHAVWLKEMEEVSEKLVYAGQIMLPERYWMERFKMLRQAYPLVFEQLPYPCTNFDNMFRIISDDVSIQRLANECALPGVEDPMQWVKHQISDNEHFQDHSIQSFMKNLFHMQRYRLEVSSLFRMFPKTGTGFKNVIFHGGDWHSHNLSRMLHNLGYKMHDTSRATKYPDSSWHVVSDLQVQTPSSLVFTGIPVSLFQHSLSLSMTKEMIFDVPK